MKKLYTILIPMTVVAFSFLMAGFGGSEGLKNSTGAPPGYTNSPGDAQNCSHCMGGTAIAVTDWISSDIPGTGYVPGMTYAITVTATGNGTKGFEASPQTMAGDLIGMLVAGTENKLVGGDKYVTHTAASGMDPKSWTFQWIAPNPGVGSVTFYACAVVGKLNTKTTMMTVQQSTLGVPTLFNQTVKVFPNPVLDQINLSYNLARSGDVTVDLFSVDGRNVATLVSDVRSGGENLETIPVDLGSGVYFLRLRAEGKSQVRKLIVQ